MNLPLTIVTGASSNHARPLLNLLWSLKEHEPYTRRIVYDLGLSPDEYATAANIYGADVRVFPFDKYPEWLTIKPRGDYGYGRDAGCYSWKPVIIHEVAREFPGLVLWLDAGNLIHRPLTRIRDELGRCGIYSPASKGTLKDWTHSETLRAWRVKPDDKRLMQNPRSAGVSGFNTSKPLVYFALGVWRGACLDPQIVCPDGATWLNHRYDQAVFSLVAQDFALATSATLCDDWLDVSAHHDNDDEATVRKIIGL